MTSTGNGHKQTKADEKTTTKAEDGMGNSVRFVLRYGINTKAVLPTHISDHPEVNTWKEKLQLTNEVRLHNVTPQIMFI